MRDFEEQTNFSVITDDGRFYNFNVHYSSYPDILNYDLLTMQRSEDQRNPDNVYFQDMGDSSPSLVGLLMETIYKANKRVLKHIASRSYGILYQLKGLYIHDGKYYFHTELSNKSNVPYQIDYITFKIVDKNSQTNCRTGKTAYSTSDLSSSGNTCRTSFRKECIPPRPVYNRIRSAVAYRYL